MNYLIGSVVAACLMSTAGHAQTQRGMTGRVPLIVINHDNGGNVINYARRVSKARISGTPVRFNGRCASACTMFLALDNRQTCITPGASFLFHRPYGGRADMNSWAENYMMERYPAWVQRWIARRGGLSKRVLKMNYSYAAKYMPTCGRKKPIVSTKQAPTRRHADRS
ncbi:hypothetical protein [Vannielia litorea]|uniref:hypothetical protein n=1 Tax=Vannielia litorea TaxID=1217970 RepID=UPI001BD0CFEE|nr:hypothetical protein [Vannielia litorea]